jgi:hypothetical protein
MGNRLHLRAEFSNKDSTIKTELTLISFEEDHVCFMYCPALDLTGYGDSEAEAGESFSQVLNIYINYTTDKGTLLKDLESHGWSVNTRRIKSPDFDFLLRHNRQFKSIVNNRNFKKFNKEVQLPSVNT